MRDRNFNIKSSDTQAKESRCVDYLYLKKKPKTQLKTKLNLGFFTWFISIASQPHFYFIGLVGLTISLVIVSMVEKIFVGLFK